MLFLYHSTLFLKVNRFENELRVECTHLNNDTEAAAWINVDVRTLQISQAGWALYRSPQYPAGLFELPELIGVEAYITGGPALKERLGAPGQEIPRELIAECFRGVLQAETFFFIERGFESAKQFDDFCEQNSIGACRYYSHLDQVEKQWTESLDSTERSYNLFNRSKTVTIQQQASGFQIIACFLDSFHHLCIRMALNEAGVVQNAAADFLCAPDKICYQNSEHMTKFIGCKPAQLDKKDIAAFAGGAEGCNHLVDLMYEIVKALRKNDH